MAGAIPAAGMASVDPRMGEDADIIGTSKEYDTQPPEYADARKGSIVYTDKSVTFEEYHYWANRTRDYEKTLSTKDAGIGSWFSVLIGKKPPPPAETAAEKTNEHDPTQSPVSQYGITDLEYYHAQRSVRSATWGAVFYLITVSVGV